MSDWTSCWPGSDCQWGSTGSGNGQFGNASIYNNGPAHVTLDAAGRVYVADPNNYRVQIFSPTGMFLGKIGGSYGTGAGAFAFPHAAAVAPGWQVYVADETDDYIQQMTVIVGTNAGPAITAITWPATQAVVRGEGIPGHTYTLQRSTNLILWVSAASNSATEGLFSLTNALPAGADSCFFRLVR